MLLSSKHRHKRRPTRGSNCATSCATMFKHGWKSLLLLGVVTVGLRMCSVGAGSGGSVNITSIQRGSIDVGATTVSFLGNLGSSFSQTTTAAAPVPARNVLLLHGAKYSAQTWGDLGTLALLADAGYRVAAVDLPVLLSNPSRDELLERICLGLGMAEQAPTVIVSPSMSGSFSVPLLLRRPELFAGYVPVAPGQALSYPPEAFEDVTGVPALIVYGELDRMGTKASSILQSIPGSRVLPMAGASHACYLDEPGLFHQELMKFLEEDAVFSSP